MWGAWNSAHGEHSAPTTAPAKRAAGRRFCHWEGNFVETTPQCDLEVMAAELETLGFSADEAVRLARFRMRAQHHGELAEQKVSERRMEFLRWLVEHGRLDH